MDGDLERAIGRLEGGQEEIKERLDRLTAIIRGDDGLEPRLRKVESDMVKVKTISTVISSIAATVISVGISIFKK